MTIADRSTGARPGLVGCPAPRPPTEGDPLAELWSDIPAHLVHGLRPTADAIVADVIAEIRRTIPEYDRPLEGAFGHVLVSAVRAGVFGCFDLIAASPARGTDWRRAFRRVGGGEYRQGRSLDAVQEAVRVGVRVAVRHIRAATDLPADTAFVVFDSVMAWGAELCAEAVAGYVEAKSASTETLERHRVRLVKLLIAEAPASPETLAEVAAAAQWPLPETAAAIAMEAGDERPAVPQEILVAADGQAPCLIAPHGVIRDPGMTSRRVVVGPVVPLADLSHSLRVARRALALADEGVLPHVRFLDTADHLTTLTILADGFLAARLAARALRPFESLNARQRCRLIATLRAWLDTRGGVPEIAEILDIHPQTVRYRMQQLTRLFGRHLNDPEFRLSLEIALRAR